jgi:cytochrome c553
MNLKRAEFVFVVACLSAMLARAARIAPQETVNSADHPLRWDAMTKSNRVEFGRTNVQFVFWATNCATTNVTITNVLPSCGCTVAQLPHTPWLLSAHSNGPVIANIDLIGKFGEMTKTMRIISSAGEQTLTMKISIPENAETIRRMQGMLEAKNDAQAVLRGECASCHVQKGEGKLGQELFAADCGICHESAHRADIVPDLAKLNHPTSPEFWKQVISEGKPGTLMPAFAKKKNGPLSDEQISSLVEYLSRKFPSRPVATATPAAISK